MADRIKELRALLAKATPGELDLHQGRLLRRCNGDVATPVAEIVTPYRRGVGPVFGQAEWHANGRLFREGLRALPLLLDVAEAARWARDHISATPHGDNCHLTDEGDGAGCRCGKESMLDHLDTALAALEAHNGSD